MHKTILLFIIQILCSFHAYSSIIVGDIAVDKVNIDTDFIGKEILSYGFLEDKNDVIVVVKGPSKIFSVRRKEKIYGMWINNKQKQFYAPSFYYIGYSDSFSDYDMRPILKNLKLGIDNILPKMIDEKNNFNFKVFENALIQSQIKKGLYFDDRDNIKFTNKYLFSANLDFPENIIRGIYTVEFYGIKDNILTGLHMAPLIVDKVGLDATISDFSINHSFLYGVISICMSLTMGLLSYFIFSKFKIIRI